MKIQLIDYEDLNFVELYATKDSSNFKVCNPDSKFLHGAIFSIFQNCFELSHEEYSYYDVTRYDTRSIVTLRQHLLDAVLKIKTIGSAEEIDRYALKQVSGIDFLNELKSENNNWRISWETTRNQLAKVGEDLIDIIDLCIDDDMDLVIKGY